MVRVCLSALVFLVLIVSGLISIPKTLANGLAADVSDRLIAITTAFVGGDVVVFGAIDEAKGDIVITMQGPRLPQTVRRKSRIAGIWVNRDRISFDDIPSFFAIAATRPLDEITSSSVRSQFSLGVDYLTMTPIDAANYEAEEVQAFADALVRNKQKAGLYTEMPLSVTFPGPKLFRTTFSFPANVPPGSYQIEVFRFVDGRVTGAQRSGLQISKVGLEADVYDFANQRSALYGIVAIIIAVAAGWLAGVVFRRA